MLPLQLTAWPVLFKPLAISCSSLLTMASKWCKLCGESGAIVWGKCLSCYRDNRYWRWKIAKALKDLRERGDPTIANDFCVLSRSEKAQFQKKHHGKTVRRLKIEIQEVIFKRRTQSMPTALAKGHMKDEVDLTEKYVNCAERLAAMKSSNI